MSEQPPVLEERRGDVAILTLNRPDTMNAFSTAMGEALQDAYRRLDADDDVRCVVLTGSGRAFCAGADFSRGAGVFSAPTADTFRSDPFTFHAWDVRKPVIAALQGHAVGLGMTMALHCDLRIMAEEAKFGIVQNRRGVVPDLRSHWTLPRLIGYGPATELLLTGRMFTAAEAAAWGLANAAVPSAEVLPLALEWAADIARNTAPLSVGLSKQLLWRDEPVSSTTADDMEKAFHLAVMGRPDATEGVQAFLERRDPSWTGSVSDDWPDEV